MSDETLVRLEWSGAVARLVLHDPARRNAIGPRMARAIAVALDAVEAAGDACRALVLTGAGPAFCAGGDMAHARAVIAGQVSGDDAGFSLERDHHPLIRRLRTLPVPTVAAVNGAAVGIGIGYALAADLVIAADDVRFVINFPALGLSPDGGLSWWLARQAGPQRAFALLAEGGVLDATAALALGLVAQIVPPAVLGETALACAQRLGGARDVALTVRGLIGRASSASFDAQLVDEERAQARLAASPAAQATIAASAPPSKAGS